MRCDKCGGERTKELCVWCEIERNRKTTKKPKTNVRTIKKGRYYEPER